LNNTADGLMLKMREFKIYTELLISIESTYYWFQLKRYKTNIHIKTIHITHLLFTYV